MPDLQVTSTSRIFYQVEPTICAILCEAFPEAFKRVAAPAPAPVAARWANSTTTSGFKFINVTCPKCRREDRFDAAREYLATFEAGLCVHAGKCPTEVLAAYGEGGIVPLGAQFK